jgi:serine/threonine protein kinase
MPPQVLMGKDISFDCDIWSLGYIVYLLVSGLHPYISNDKNNFYYIKIS